MQSIIVTNHPLHANPLHRTLKRLNIDALCVRPSALKGWQPDTDALIFMESVDSRFYEYLERLVDQLPSDVPLIFLSPLSGHFSRYFKGILDRCIQLDEGLPLNDQGRIISEIMIKIFDQYQDEFMCGPMTLNRRLREVDILGCKVQLTRKEFYLLDLLAQNLGRVTTRERMIDYVWDKRSYVTSNTIDVYISRIRKKLKTAEFSPVIQTVPCLGYSLRI